MNFKRIVSILFSALIIFIYSGLLQAEIDIGQDLSIQYITQNNFSDYDDAIEDHETFYLGRLKFYLEGRITEDVIANMTLQSVGIWGTERSTSTIQLGNYEYPNFTPWIEKAYIQMNNLLSHDLKIPVTLRIGKQSLKFGDGIILDDDGNGMFAIFLEGKLPYKINLRMVDAKILSFGDYTHIGTKYLNVGCLYLDYRYKKADCSLYYFQEIDKSKYYLKDAVSKKTFYGVRVEGKTKEKFSYMGEIIKQGGKKTSDDGTIGKYDAFAFIIGAEADSSKTKMGVPTVKLGYVFGSGDTAEADQKLTLGGFSPNTSSKLKEFGDNDYGEIFTELLPGIANQSILMFGVEFNTDKKLNYGLDYIAISRIKPKGSYGEEVDIFFTTKYEDRPNLRIVYAFLNPHIVLKNIGSHVTKTSIELIYKF